MKSGHRLRKRKILDGILYATMGLVTIAVLVSLILILIYILRSQAGYLNFSFITDVENGILPMIVTTVYMVIVSIAVSLPIGIAGAIFLNEYSGNSLLIVNTVRIRKTGTFHIPGLAQVCLSTSSNQKNATIRGNCKTPGSAAHQRGSVCI